MFKTMIISISFALVSPALLAKGLKDLKPDSETIEKAKETIDQVKEAVDKKLEGKEVEPKKDKQQEIKKEVEKKEPTGDGEFYLGLGFGFASLKGSGGSWDTGFSGDFELGVRFMKIMGDRVQLYGTYRFVPVDIIVTENANQYKGVVEQHLFGASARYVLASKLHITAHGALGLASSSLKPTGTLTSTEDPEESGAAISLGGGAQWLVSSKVWLGAFLSLGAGTFQYSQLGVSTTVSL
ncbi:outer membrane beta-barrel protein [Pseudobacteriovorax antillogorgiicola]|uniref:Outer membrane protein beta-barrel domain-containing protein n=1 Tax=Pseudobacteriovorax antillogorgiicola TaxID=1513793 RepID=A0A1Y6B3Q2_9BACT|nr:outer membrane beta-barrel protein [Pseudobacteriovorax antillogorgiicola]TCS59258.1 hypothetical protein EDD56_101163 [Pseudobacteriovorax antillogorgiicola]SME89973.1 hypothetical protein SAMN06296036_101323 [Pseudobacteriovorax antillogorgiicola]